MTTITHEISGNQTWLTSLLQPLQTGDEIILTQYGEKIARLVPVDKEDASSKEQRYALVARLQKSVAAKMQSGIPDTDAARSQDFLYDENGLPA